MGMGRLVRNSKTCTTPKNYLFGWHVEQKQHCFCVWYNWSSSFQQVLRLALVSLLNCKMDNFVCLIGLLCSSFVAINRATNRRFPFCALGDVRQPSVQVGNALTSRFLGFKGFDHWWKSVGRAGPIPMPSNTCNHPVPAQPCKAPSLVMFLGEPLVYEFLLECSLHCALVLLG